MKVDILSCIEGARAARGVTVIMDVFRASNTIIACLAGKAEYIIPVGELDQAFEMKKRHPDHLLLGERGGLPPEGFDYGNSPARASRLELSGRKIILTTSAGSQGIVHSKGADQLLIASFANINAVARYIKEQQPAIVSLVAIGNNALEKATEDEECAVYLKSLLESAVPPAEGWKERILVSDGANRLRRLNQHKDLEFCLRLNTHDFVPKYDRKMGQITV